MNFMEVIRHARMPIAKKLVKKGTIKLAVVETTPIVWHDKLLRFEWIRNNNWGKFEGVTQDEGFYHFIDMSNEEEIGKPFAFNHSFGCSYTEDNVVYCHGTRGNGGGNVLDVFWSDDLENWKSKEILKFPKDIELYNTSVCKDENGYIMAIEIGGDNPIVGVPYTIIFAKSQNLLDWELLPTDKHIFSQERYTACPSIRYYDGYYYIVYLETAPYYRSLPYIVRSKDLIEFEPGIRNPVLMFPDEDKKNFVSRKIQ